MKKIIDKELSWWAIPLRYGYRCMCGLLPNKMRIKQLNANGYEILTWANEDIGKKLFLLHTHESDEVEFYKQNIKRDDVCVDVGGNIGYYSLLFSKLSGSGGRVYVFEPIKRNSLAIELSAEINGLKNITIFKGVASNFTGEAHIAIPEQDGAYAHLINTEDAQSADSLPVASITLDSFVINNGVTKVDIMKIDVEGAEFMVLQGAKSIFGNALLRPRIVMVELVSEFLAQNDSSIQDVLTYMSEFGYQPYFATAGGKLMAYKHEDFDKVFNIFFLISST